MQCKQCNRQMYVSYNCPYCKEYYCNEHTKPNTHNCQGYTSQNPPTTSPHMRTRQDTNGMRENPETPPTTAAIQRKIFIATIILLITEETLRLVSYVKNSPSLELNIYVAIASMWLTPYIASSTVFLSMCGLLFATRKLNKTERTRDHTSSLRMIVAIGVYAIVAVMIIPSIAGWIYVLSV